MNDLEMKQQPDHFRYYITNDALNVGTFPHMEGMTVKESVKPVDFENGTVKAYGFIDYPRPLTQEQEREYSLIPSSQNANHLKTAEMGMEQNYNQIDGIINNQEPPRVNQGYIIIDSETVGNQEIVLAQNQKAPQPFATWRRNISNDEQTGQENFFWGHYFTDPEAARKDFNARVQEQREDLAEQRPSILSQLKSDAARTDMPKTPAPEHKKDVPER